MRICIVGGGHIGTTLSCYIKYTHPEFHVSLFTNHPEKFATEIRCNDIEKQLSYSVKLDVISSDPSVAADEAQIVFVALPHFLVERAFKSIAPFVGKNAFIGVLPGGGGCEFFFADYFNSTNTLFGFQRVPFTAKLVTYGQETNLKSWKPYSVVATLQRDKIPDACELIEACGLKTKAASNYLEIALTPTNPLLHTSRTYEIFGKHDKDYVFDEKLKFYVGWTDEASRILMSMDAELHNLLDAMTDIDTSAIRPLSEHYESPTIEDLTKKINSIATFQTVYAPLIPAENGYRADTSSRMFTEDFPWGLLIIRSYFDLFHMDAPMMDRILRWYADYMGLEWYIGDALIGRDLKNTGIIRNYGVYTSADMIAFYKK